MLTIRLRAASRNDHGFTLPELLVVCLIISILAGIAVPTFLGAKRNGHDSEAQTSLKSALSAQRTYYVDYQEYTADPVALRKIEANINWDTTDAEAQGVMAALNGTPPQVVVLVSTSRSGTMFCIMNIAADLGAPINGQQTAGTYYSRKSTPVTTPPVSASTSDCDGAYVRTDAGWSG
jgi:prepilin-type N-terminal cleavage/methylation domain-containing protein